MGRFEDDDDGEDLSMLDALRTWKGKQSLAAKAKDVPGVPDGWHPPLMPNMPRDISKTGGMPPSFLKGKSAADYGQNAFKEPLPGDEQMAKVNGAMRLPPVEKPAPTSMKDMMNLPDFDPGAGQFAKDNATAKGAAMLVSVNPSSYFGEDEIMSKAAQIPYTRPKAQRAAFKGPSSDEPFAIGEEGDPGLGREPWNGAQGTGPVPQPGSMDRPAGLDQESEDLSALEGFPEDIPTEDLTDEIDIDTDANRNQDQVVDNRNPGQAEDQRSELQRYMDQMNGGEEQAKDDRLSEFMRNGQKMNSDMGLYKLLMASANKIGSHAGQQSSDEPFNTFADGAVKNTNNMGDLVSKDRQQDKKKQDDKLKALMFMQKQQDDKDKYQEELKFRGQQLTDLGDYRKESLQVQREGNEGRNKLTDATLRAQMGLGYDKLSAGEREMLMKQSMNERELAAKIAAQNADLELKKNPPVKPMSELDREDLIAKKRENGWLAQGLDKNGKAIKTKVQEIQEKEAAEVYGDWIQKGGKANVENNIQKLKDVKAKILGDKMASGPIQGFLPEAAQTFIGMKGPTYKSDVEDAISSTYRETLGGSFTLAEGEGLKKNAYDPKQTPEENARRIQRIIDKMEVGKQAKDKTVQYLDENGGIQLPGGQAPKSTVPPAPPGMVNIQGPDGDIRPVPKASAQKYLDKGGKLVQ